MYQVEFGIHAQDQADALPLDAIVPFLELREALSLAPWNGKSLRESNPNANMLSQAFGLENQGLATYIVIEYRRHVEVLDITWIEI